MNRDELCASIHAGEAFEYFFFWGHTPRSKGEIDDSCLSQWYRSVFAVDGVSYPTAEHFMMAEKARLFDDEGALAKILDAATPAEAAPPPTARPSTASTPICPA